MVLTFAPVSSLKMIGFPCTTMYGSCPAFLCCCLHYSHEYTILICRFFCDACYWFGQALGTVITFPVAFIAGGFSGRVLCSRWVLAFPTTCAFLFHLVPLMCWSVVSAWFLFVVSTFSSGSSACLADPFLLYGFFFESPCLSWWCWVRTALRPFGA